MMSILSTIVMAVLATAPAQTPEVSVYRSLRAPDVTVVDGMFRVDPELLGTNLSCRYGASVAIRDAQGNLLKQEAWDGECPRQDGRLAAALETFQFAMPSARFTVEVSVYPQGQPESKRTTVVEVDGLPPQPLASDLVLARRVGFIDSTAADATWTMRRGMIGLEVPSELIVDPARPEVSFYVEVYPDTDRPLDGTVFGIIRRRDGRELARVPVQKFEQETEPRPVAGRLPLEGLPQGDYTLEILFATADTTVVRGRDFQVAAPALAGGGPNGWFGTLTDQQLEEMFDAVVAFGLTKSQAELYEAMPVSEKRGFLARQFGPDAPTPDDGDESALDAYLARSAYVKARFGERAGHGERAPWLTPRGRIWMLRGVPSSQLSRPRPTSGSPYEIWHYAVGPGHVYIFGDDTGMGHYRLLFSNDPNEQSIPDWDRYLDAEALSDLARMGIRPGGS